ncbi:hypothetical protein MESS4_720117 [Mesorhizobium sp. STM 4661]|nr:hypothetical protein MESS4_720117 [Mesorhizobium sp. STM 4661]
MRQSALPNNAPKISHIGASSSPTVRAQEIMACARRRLILGMKYLGSLCYTAETSIQGFKYEHRIRYG